ncbi:MAG: DUF362 domain-containing protein, partial [Candidatus Sumerlaeia bacterium]|nr:DUF362 domain-containing protein [Candidatus Sumerlaeia bacterium]
MCIRDSRSAYPAEPPASAGNEPLNQLAGVSNVLQTTSRVSLIKGDDQKRNTIEALKAIEPEIRRGLEGKKRVLIKPNFVHTAIPLCATQAPVAEGIIEFLRPFFKGEIVIGESSANAPATEGFKNYGYEELARKYQVPLIDFDTQPFTYMYCIDDRFRVVPARTTMLVFDPDTYLVSAARLKTHDRIVATLSLKNLLVGAVIKDTTAGWGKDKKGRNDKIITHGGNTIRGINFNLFKLAEQLRPHLALIDGFQGMEGNGPTGGTPVDHRIAIASTDFLAADRVAIEVMGIDWKKVGYLNFCAQAGMGQGDLAKIEIQGEKPENVKRTYKLHSNMPKQYEWG